MQITQTNVTNPVITKIKKRDGREADFDIQKISEAIMKAAKNASASIDQVEALQLSLQVADYLVNKMNNPIPTVEEVQDVVEKILIYNEHSKTAKAYILYRAERSRIRDINNRLMKTYEEITFSDSEDSNLKRENGNINSDSAMGTMLKYGSEGSKHFNSIFVLKPNHADAHNHGDIHIHDMDFLTLTTTCCQIDLLKLFKGGFGTGHGYIREPNSVASYAALACIAIQSNQNDQHGGQSIPNFDYVLADGVRRTFKKFYFSNFLKYFKTQDDFKDINIDEIKTIQKGLDPRMDELVNKEKKSQYIDLETKLFAEHNYDPYYINRAQEFALNEALEETDKTTHQAMEAVVHNLNTMHSRAGAQVPFSSINYGTDTSAEGRMVTKNLLIALDEGMGNGETPIWPVHIFKIKEGINYNETDTNYDLFELACQVSTKRLYPNFSFLDAPFNLQYYREGRPETEVAYMGCRTRVIGNVYDPSQEIAFSRGNLSYTSLNLPRIALETKGQDIAEFSNLLYKRMDLIVDQLMERYYIQAKKKVKNYPFLMEQGIWLDSDDLDTYDEIGEVLKHGTLSIGFIGLAEALTVLIGKHHGESEMAQTLGLEIIQDMRLYLDRVAEEKKMNFTLIATPAEGLSGRFVEMDRKIYGEIPGVTDKIYYTNSFHIPVGFNISIPEKIRLEAPYHALTNAGHITFIELDGDTSKNVKTIMKVVRCMKEAGIGYGAINHPVDQDPICHYTGIIDDVCPKCGRDESIHPFERIRRITGYLVKQERFNDAKLQELKDRVKHDQN